MKKIVALLFLCCCKLAFGQTATANFADNSTTSISAGSSTAVNGTGNTQSIQFNGSAQQAPLGMIAIPSHQAPSVFQYLPNNFGMPAEITGMALEVFYDQKCQPEESATGDSHVIQKQGWSGLTKITVTTHPDLSSLRNGDKPSKVRMDLSGGGSKHYKCLGMLTAVADKDALEKGQPVGFSVLASDIRKVVRSEFSGVNGDIIILSSANYWSGALGVSNDSSGISLGTSLAHIVGKFSSLGIAPGVSGGSGVSSPTAMPGLTAMILVETDEKSGIEINLAETNSSPRAPVQETPIGDNGKKAAAENK